MPSDGTEPQADTAPLPELKFLKTLVTVLAGTMIVGLIAVIALLVIRLGPQNNPQQALPAGLSGSQALTLPESLLLPEGKTAQSVSYSANRIVILTTDDDVLVFDHTGESIGAFALTLTP